jgi:hypothetical protein
MSSKTSLAISSAIWEFTLYLSGKVLYVWWSKHISSKLDLSYVFENIVLLVTGFVRITFVVTLYSLFSQGISNILYSIHSLVRFLSSYL